jgi:predicted ATPase
MVIGAYRDNEVTAAHPLRRKLDAIRQAGAIVHEIVLAPLTQDDVGQLLADTLHCARRRAAPLAHLVHEKTAGNPFFIIQFLYALADEGLLTFEYRQAHWAWDLNRIHAKGYTDNAGLPGQQRCDHNPVARAREIGGGGPRRAVGGSPSRAG